MKKQITTISPSQWLSLVNAEADPTLEVYELNYYRMQDQYAVGIKSGYGTFLSPLTTNVDDLDSLAEGVKSAFEAAKGTSSPMSPGTFKPIF